MITLKPLAVRGIKVMDIIRRLQPKLDEVEAYPCTCNRCRI